MPYSFFEANQRREQDHLNSAPFLKLTKDIDNLQKTLVLRENTLRRNLMNYCNNEFGQIDETFKPSKIYAPINRAERILIYLREIQSRFKDNNADKLDEDQLKQLQLIAFYTARCLPDHAINTYSKQPMISFEEFIQYKKASDSLNKFSHPYQKLSGDVLQLTGLAVSITLTVLNIFSSLAWSIRTLYIAGLLCVSLGSYLARSTPYRQLKNEVNKTLKSAACHEVGYEPDYPFLEKLGRSTLACFGGY